MIRKSITHCISSDTTFFLHPKNRECRKTKGGENISIKQLKIPEKWKLQYASKNHHFFEIKTKITAFASL